MYTQTLCKKLILFRTALHGLKILDEISNKRYMAVALLEGSLFFADSQTGAEHDVRFEIRICVDDFIDTMQFSNLRNPSDIRVALSCMDLTAHVH